ncbi:MAG: hypothetical protein A3K19_04455 [Lentisphaerae bacterium RIFOXYB12_FULL_65_16]|nr:MAG: hypothetical protein A3K18_34925 [Lentisphaerae bacterium RIFOXYA12_64_32]OGV84572.1 MAG: hypothetical protein A3K19_04455 [Lentisphaerae bacterium RIFOXYB12_FULL_65_16]
MIRGEVIEAAMYEAMHQAAVHLPPDVEARLRMALAEESEPLAREHLRVSLENAALAAAGRGLVCGDTGFPLFFVRAGSRTAVDGGFGAIRTAAAAATARATRDSFLRPTMVDPLTRGNPGTNLGPGMPKVELQFAGDGDGLDIVAVPKGGGSEIFGTFYRMLYPADGEKGIKRFVIDCIRDGCYAGKICPPAIVGVGIGGSSDLCMKLAKEAALLRQLGEPHPRADVAHLEQELLLAARSLGLGPMGSRGVNAVMALHIELAMTHTAALPVAVNAQCLVGRRWCAAIDAGGRIACTGTLPPRETEAHA